MTDIDDIKNHVISNYAIEPIDISYIKEGVTNTNHLVVTKEGKFLFKIYNFKRPEQVQFEVNVLRELEKYNFLSPRVVERKNGESIGEYEGKPCLVYVYIDGEVDRDWSASTLEQVGKYMGAKHSLLSDFSDRTKSGTFDLEEMKKLVDGGLERFKEAEFPDSEELIEFVKTHLGKVSFPEDLPKGITHHDIKHENVILSNGKIAGIVDFDLTYYGVLLNDIATTIIWECFNGDDIDIQKAQSFLDGYEDERPLTLVEQEHFCEAIHFRLAREVFSSPFDVLPNYINTTKKRSDEFKRRVEKFEKIKDSIKFSFKQNNE